MDAIPNAYSAGKSLTVESYFKRKVSEVVATNTEVGESSSVSASTIQLIHEEQPQSKLARVEQYIDFSSLERDPGKRIPIGQYDVEQRDRVRIFYLRNGPYQPFMEKYPASGKNHLRRFQGSWFNKFRSWLEYSIEKDAAFCLPCYLFGKHSGSRTDGRDAFTSKGFRSWRKVGGKNCALVTHMGCSPNSPHNVCVKLCAELMDKTEHIEAFTRRTEQMAADDRLRLKTSIMAVRWLTFQASSFRENGVRVNLLNMDDFIGMIDLLASCNEDISNVVLQNAPLNAKYISPSIQKEILYICARRVRSTIREEIGDSKFCLIVDGVNDDELKRERLALILRFVDQDGYVQERFFDVIHVSDASPMTLKKEINGVLSRHYLSVCNLRGQGYNGSSEMRAEWNTTQALFLKDCPYAYHGHSFAHHLDFALVLAAREVSTVHQFFTKLDFIVNVVTISLEKYDRLRVGQKSNIADEESKVGIELHRGVLQLIGDAKWDSHFDSILSLLCMFQITCEVLLKISKEGNYSLRGDADAAYDTLRSFDFVFLLHLMKDLLGLGHNLCQALQRKNEDILNVMTLVFTTKHLIQRMKESGWQNLLKEVESFCEKHDISLPNMNAPFVPTRGRCQPNVGYVTLEYHYHVELFIATIDMQLQELNSRFNENIVELLTLSAALDPRDNYKSLNVDQICELAIRFYPDDFTEIERVNLRTQVQHYELDVPHHSDLKNLSTLSGLCQGLIRAGKSETYHLIDRLLRLLLTLPLFASTSERSFSTVNIADSRFKNKMEDDFLADFLVTSIEKEIAKSFDTDSIVEEFYILKELRTQSR